MWKYNRPIFSPGDIMSGKYDEELKQEYEKNLAEGADIESFERFLNDELHVLNQIIDRLNNQKEHLKRLIESEV